MSSSRWFVVVSGLPGSGKSTVGRALGRALHLPVIDKDVILEGLFDSLGSPDLEARERLSRAADEVLLRLAASCDRGILVNWWKPRSSPARLASLGVPLVEVLCDAAPEVCATRWRSRPRHPGHHDGSRPEPTLPPPFEPLLPSAPLVRINTSGDLDEAELVRVVNAVVVQPEP